jgi:hypothetical protein
MSKEQKSNREKKKPKQDKRHQYNFLSGGISCQRASSPRWRRSPPESFLSCRGRAKLVSADAFRIVAFAAVNDRVPV